MTRDLHDLLTRVLPGHAITDRELAEAILRLIGALLRLYEEHTPDSRGRCPLCGRRTTCPVDQMPTIRLLPGRLAYTNNQSR